MFVSATVSQQRQLPPVGVISVAPTKASSPEIRPQQCGIRALTNPSSSNNTFRTAETIATSQPTPTMIIRKPLGTGGNGGQDRQQNVQLGIGIGPGNMGCEHLVPGCAARQLLSDRIRGTGDHQGVE